MRTAGTRVAERGLLHSSFTGNIFQRHPNISKYQKYSHLKVGWTLTIAKNVQNWKEIFSNALGPWKITYSNNLKIHHFNHKNNKIYNFFLFFLTKVTKIVVLKKAKEDIETIFETLPKTTVGLKKSPIPVFHHKKLCFNKSTVLVKNKLLQISDQPHFPLLYSEICSTAIQFAFYIPLSLFELAYIFKILIIDLCIGLVSFSFSSFSQIYPAPFLAS